jgi:upstream activation factor subunit UAF30
MRAKKKTATKKAKPKAKHVARKKTTQRSKKMAKDNKKSKFMAPLQVSDELAAVVGRGSMPRTEVTKKIWAYIKANKLQDAKNRRNINPDDKLAKVFGSKKSINMFEMTKLVSKHLK